MLHRPRDTTTPPLRRSCMLSPFFSPSLPNFSFPIFSQGIEVIYTQNYVIRYSRIAKSIEVFFRLIVFVSRFFSLSLLSIPNYFPLPYRIFIIRNYASVLYMLLHALFRITLHGYNFKFVLFTIRTY